MPNPISESLQFVVRVYIFIARALYRALYFDMNWLAGLWKVCLQSSTITDDLLGNFNTTLG